ncbi:MAG: helix-turn-helix transcriptional regulator [Pseudomonadota bacterium]
MKKYTNVFEQAERHPKAKQFHEENLARIRLAEAIHRERMAQNLTMKQLAERAYITPAMISRIENAQISTGIDVIFKIFKALGQNKIELQCV